jgi:hypothetical protein
MNQRMRVFAKRNKISKILKQSSSKTMVDRDEQLQRSRAPDNIGAI